ncbi:MAG: phosphatidylinositol phosphate kinase family protein [Candidatus Pacebacteria bacterium]|nr:phosphatidylinositol phosphate kinase family protein [Candidatus Paceibacterota bacterium]
MSKGEFDFLRRVLPAYYEHLKNHPNSLLARFYGCHKITFYRSGIGRSKEFRFVIMNNVFSSGVKIHRRYDLKGSTVGRSVGINAYSPLIKCWGIETRPSPRRNSI